VNYTATAIGAVLGAVGFDMLLARTRLLARRAFWTAYAIMLGFQLLVNGVLTGLRVVRYDRHRIIGPRHRAHPADPKGPLPGVGVGDEIPDLVLDHQAERVHHAL